MSQLTQYLKNLLLEGETKEVIEKLYFLAQKTEELRLRETDYLHLLGQFNRLEKQSMQGTISGSDLQLRQNQINRNTIAYINGIPSSLAMPPSFNPRQAAPDPVAPPANDPKPAEATSLDGTTKILMLQANPRGTVKLNLTKEHAEIHSQISAVHKDLQLIPRKDVRITDMTQEIIQANPQIVHFSGHGRSTKFTAPDPSDPFAEPQPGEEGGLLLVSAQGFDLHPASANWLGFTFQSMVEIQKVPIQIVFLNACHSGEQAAAIAKHVPFVIGTSDEVLDDAAWAFSKGFYFRLANDAGNEIDETMVRQAYNNGQILAMTANEPMDRFVLYINGVKQ